MKRALTVSWLVIAVILFALPLSAEQRMTRDQECSTCFTTSVSGQLDVNWNAPTIDNGSLRDEVLYYHDDSFEGQIGCGGGCGFGVRFTFDTPIILTGLTLFTQGDADVFDGVISIYADEAGGIAGPPAAPVGPGDPSAIWESTGWNLPSDGGALAQYDVAVDNLVLNAGDYYVVVWENNSGFLGIANDLQTNYLDRNWVSTGDGSWQTIDEAVASDPTLVGNFGINATFLYQDISGAYMIVSPSNVDYGVIQLSDGAQTSDVTITNLGDTDFDVTGVAVAGDAGYTTSLATPVTVTAGTSVTMDVTFTPTVAGVFSGTYTISSTADNIQSYDVTSSITVFDGFPDYFVWNPSASSSGMAFVDALTELGYTAYEDPNLFFFGDPLAAGFDAIFVTLGIYPDNFSLGLGSPEETALVDYLTAGSPVYMEGGDTWAFDDITAVHGFFGIDGVSDGGADIVDLVGLNLWDGMNFSYTGANNYMDHLEPSSVDAFPAFTNPADGAFHAIANLTPGANTIGASFEFGGLVDDSGVRTTKTDLLASYLDFLAMPYVDLWPPEISDVTQFTYTLDTAGPYTIEAVVTDNVDIDIVNLFYSLDGGAFTSVGMTGGVDGVYSADIPGQPVGTVVAYYVLAMDSEGNEGVAPEGAPGELYSFSVLSHLPPMYPQAESGLDGTVVLEWVEPGNELPPLLDCADALVDDMPFNAFGSTTGMGDDFDVSGSDNEDFAFQLYVPQDATFSMSLCSEATDYDTKMEIFNEDCITSTGYYDDDDFANCDINGLYSGIYGAFLPAGTYLIVVDGFSSNNGNFEINVWEETAGRSAPETVAYDRSYELEKLASAGIGLHRAGLSSSPRSYASTREMRELMYYGIYRTEAPPVLLDAANLVATTADSTVLTYTDFPLVNGTTYYYRISAIYDDGEAGSEEVSATPVNHLPAAPLNLVGTVDNMTVTLDWDDNSEYDFDHYNIYRNGVVVGGTSVSDFTETLEFGGYYDYWVTAVDAEDAESEDSDNITLPVGNLPPVHLDATSGLDGMVVLEWDPPGTLGPDPLECADFIIDDLPYTDQNSNVGMGDDFDVTFSDGEDVAYQLWMQNDGMVDITLCSDFTDYDTKLEIFNADCFTSTGFYNDDNFDCTVSGLQSGLFGVFLPEGDYLIVVDGFGGSTGNYEINVSESAGGRALVEQDLEYETRKLAEAGINLEPWQMSSAPQHTRELREFTGYNVYRDGAMVNAELLAVDAITYTDAYIPNGVEYCYYVEAVYDAGGNSVSETVCATPVNYPPAPPQNLVFVINDHDIDLTWDANTDYDFASYNVYRDGVLILNTVDTTFAENLPISNIYRYFVTALDAEGAESDPSNQVTLPVGNLPPSFAAAADGLDGTVVLSWSEPGLLGEEFSIQYDDGILENAFYYYDNFENGYAHGTRFETVGLVELQSAQVKILSEGDNYWPWPDGTHGPVRIIIMDDIGGEPGNVIYEEEATAADGWATITPGLSGIEDVFYVIVSHTGDWSIEGDPEGFGVDGFVDYPEAMFTLDGGAWYTGDFNGYGGDYMIRANVLAEGLPTVLTYAGDTPAYSEDQILTHRQGTQAVYAPSYGSDPAGASSRPYPGTVDNATRALVEYQIFRSETSPVVIEASNMIAQLDLNTFEYVDFPLTNGVTQYYHVAAYYDDPETSLSPELVATPMNHPPMAPTGLAGSGDEDANVVLDWDDNSDYDFASYNVYRDDVFIVNVATSDYSENVTDAGLYDYFVTAVDAEDAESEPSESITVPTGPLPPGFVTAESGLDGQVFLEWTAPGDVIMNFSVEILTDNYPGETSWDLYSDGVEVANDGGIIGDAGTLYTWDLEISPGVYTWSIYDAFGDGICCGYGEGYYNIYLNGTLLATGGDFGTEESWTFDASGLVTLRTVSEYLGTPVGMKGQEPENAATLLQRTLRYPMHEQHDVTIDRERSFDGFNIYRDGALVNTDGMLPTDTYSYLDGYIPNGVEYTYTVSAVYTTAETHSDPVTATPMNHPPMMPTGLIGSVDDATSLVSLDWDDNTDYDIASYNVYDGDVLLANVATSDYSETPADGVYRYKVSAVDAEGAESDLTPSLMLIVGEAPPENLMANGHFDDHINLHWYAPGGGGMDTEFRYDDGVVIGQLGYPAAPENAAMGAAHPVNGSLWSVSWYITSEGGPHNEVKIIVLGLDESGIPNMDDVLFVSDILASTDDTWNDYDLPEPVETPNGFFLGINTPFMFTALGQDDGVGEPYEFQWGTQWAVYDYTDNTQEWFDVGDGFPYNFTIRGYGQVYGARDIAYNHDDHVAPKDLLTQLQHGEIEPVNIERLFVPQIDATRDIDFYNVYKDGSIIAQTTDTEYNDMVDEDNPFFYAVSATYTNGEESVPSEEVEAFAWMEPMHPFNAVGSVTGHLVTLEWIDPDVNMDGSPCVDLEGINIYRDGTMIGTVGPLEWEFVDTGVSDGPHTYELVAFDEVPNLSDPAVVDVWVGPAPYFLEILTDNYPGETSWDIMDANNNVVMSILPGDLTSTGTLYEWFLDLEPGEYTFNIYDAFGDGICCAYGEGYWQITHGEEILASGGEFADMESATFTIEEGILYGDLDQDGLLTITDLVRLIEIVTFNGEPPTADELAVIDLNADGAFNVLDVVILLEAVLEFPGLAKDAPVEGTAAAEVAPITLLNTREWQDIPVSVNYDGYISGFQADLSFDPAVVELGTPTLGEGNENVSVYTNVQDGLMRVLAVDLAGGQIDVGTGLLMNVPVQVIDENATGPMDFNIDELILAGPGGTPIDVDVVVSVVEVGLPLPTEYSLVQNYPNPFNPTTTIGYALPEAGDVQLLVYNMLGQVVRTLVATPQDAGYYDVQWNGTNDLGEQVATGIYIYHLQAGKFSKTYKMAFIK